MFSYGQAQDVVEHVDTIGLTTFIGDNVAKYFLAF